MKPNRSEPARASDPDVLAASGQIDAKLLRRYEGALRDFFGRRVYSRDEVDDLVQEAFARLIESGGRRDVEYPAAYLFRIASNLIHDRGGAAPAVRFRPSLTSRTPPWRSHPNRKTDDGSRTCR